MRTPINILLVEDNPGDVLLALEHLSDLRVENRVHVARDGIEALAMVRDSGPGRPYPRPDLVLLDLNLPRKDGREVLAAMKADPELALIPVVVLTSSAADGDVALCYAKHANCFIRKPIELEEFATVIQTIERFWFDVVVLPSRPGSLRRP